MQDKSNKNESAKKVQTKDNAHNSEMKEALSIQILESMKKEAFLKAQKEAEERGFSVFIYLDWIYLGLNDAYYKIEYNQFNKTLVIQIDEDTEREFKIINDLIDFLLI